MTSLTANAVMLVIQLAALMGPAQAIFKSIQQSTLYVLSKISAVNVSSESHQSRNSTKFTIIAGTQHGLVATSLYSMTMLAQRTRWWFQ